MRRNIFLGFDIGGTKCAVIRGFKEKDRLVADSKIQFRTSECPGPMECLNRLIQNARQLLHTGTSEEILPAGIGISCGGPLDSSKGIILSPPNLPGWNHVEIVRFIKDHFPVPVFLQNDANACALAEWKYGAGNQCSNMIFLTFGTGMGAGLILNGKLYSGTNDMAGECGHIRLEPYGPSGYGKAGSMEGFCSGGGIAKLAAMKIEESRQNGCSVSWAEENNRPDAKTIAEAALRGDPLALEIFHDSALHLGRALSILIDILNPERIVIGSIFARSEVLFREEMMRILRTEALERSLSVCTIHSSLLGDQIGDMASLCLAEEISAR